MPEVEPNFTRSPSLASISASAPRPQGGPANAPELEPSNIRRFHAFGYRNFRLLWLGSAFTSAAMWIQQTTMNWVAYDLTGSGSILGGVNAVRIVPALFVTPFAGVVADRVSRNLIIGFSQISLAIMTGLLALSVATGRLEVWHLFAFSLMAAIANSFNMPARQTMVFDVVPRSVVPNAVALNNLANSIMRTLGPLLGGVLITAVGAALNFSLQSAAYLGVMVTVMLMRLPRARSSVPRRQVLRDLKEGYAFVLKTPQARLLLLMMIINPTFLIPLHLGLLPIYSKDIFDSGPGGLGIMFGILGAGGILGGLFTASLNSLDRRGLLQLAGLFIHSGCHIIFATVGYLTGNIWLSVPFLFVAGAAEQLHMTTNQTVLQLMAPDHMRGRISAALQLSPAFMSAGILIAGTLSDVFSPQAAGIGFSTAGFGVVLAIFIFSPRMRDLRLSRLGQGT